MLLCSCYFKLIALGTLPSVQAFLNRGYAVLPTKGKSRSSNLRPGERDTPIIDESLFVAEEVIDLGFNPAYVSYAHMSKYGPTLMISTFFNVAHNPNYVAAPFHGSNNSSNVSSEAPQQAPVLPYIPFHRDMVALVDLEEDAETSPIVPLTDVAGGFPKTVWPNRCERVPDEVLPFEAVVIPQGWFATMQPGRLTVVNVATLQEYVIHQSTNEAPRFYHQAQFVDMDKDGYKDIVTVRSSFKIIPSFSPPTGELVWFRNPGPDALQPSMPWEEHVIVQGLGGPDVAICVHDVKGEDDGVPEIAASQFFAGLPPYESTPWASPSRLTLFGAPDGQTWADVGNGNSSLIQIADILRDEGMIFGCEFVDLNNDGRVDLLVNNHQERSSVKPGRVLALEQPVSGKIFEDPWEVHILLDNIRANPEPSVQSSFGRMAPGGAKSFFPVLHGNKNNDNSNEDDDNGDNDKSVERPWIVVSGDEAGKVWVLKPTDTPWMYDGRVIFDINDYYGPNTTQTVLKDPYGITISTIGDIGIREDPNGAYLYIPVYEATDIHVFHHSTSHDDSGDDSSDDSGAMKMVTSFNFWVFTSLITSALLLV